MDLVACCDIAVASHGVRETVRDLLREAGAGAPLVLVSACVIAGAAVRRLLSVAPPEIASEGAGAAVLGVSVGLVVVLMYMPIFELAGSIN